MVLNLNLDNLSLFVDDAEINSPSPPSQSSNGSEELSVGKLILTNAKGNNTTKSSL